MTHWYAAVLGALATSVLFLLWFEVRARPGRRRRRRNRECKPMFQVRRNGRVRFELEDLRRSATVGHRRLPRPDLNRTIPDGEGPLPDLFGHRAITPAITPAAIAPLRIPPPRR